MIDSKDDLIRELEYENRELKKKIKKLNERIELIEDYYYDDEVDFIIKIVEKIKERNNEYKYHRRMD